MPGRMKGLWRLGGAVLGLAVVASAIALILNVVSAPTEASDSLLPKRPPLHYINMEGAAKSAFTHARESYGLSLAGSLTEEQEDAACPSHVVARKGQVFWCQALLEGELVPVEMELISSLGFFRVAKVGRNRVLEEGHQERLNIEYQEKCEYEFPALGRRYQRCMYY